MDLDKWKSATSGIKWDKLSSLFVINSQDFAVIIYKDYDNNDNDYSYWSLVELIIVIFQSHFPPFWSSMFLVPYTSKEIGRRFQWIRIFITYFVQPDHFLPWYTFRTCWTNDVIKLRIHWNLRPHQKSVQIEGKSWDWHQPKQPEQSEIKTCHFAE